MSPEETPKVKDDMECIHKDQCPFYISRKTAMEVPVIAELCESAHNNADKILQLVEDLAKKETK